MNRNIAIDSLDSPDNYIIELISVTQKLIDYPPPRKKYIRLRQNNDGDIVGWDIIKVELFFNNSGSYIRIAESVVKSHREGRYNFHSFSYHFEPEYSEDRLRFRVDLDNVSLHGNPDKRFCDKHHLDYPDDIKLNINKYNSIVAIYVAHTYLHNNEYPFDNNYADKYNDIINNALRGVTVE